MHALAGNYGPAARRAEESNWAIVVGRDAVHVTGFSIPTGLEARMKQLLDALGEVISVGKHRMPRSCGAKRATASTGQASETSRSGG
jgi:hypothetical protein